MGSNLRRVIQLKLKIWSEQHSNMLINTLYTKFTNSTEKFRGFISTHRCDIDYSAMYKPMEEVFIQIGKGKDDDPVYKLPKCEQVLIENFLQVREGKQAWGKSDVDAAGNPKIYEPETGRPIMTSEGGRRAL